jgi:hypothetical protein
LSYEIDESAYAGAYPVVGQDALICDHVVLRNEYFALAAILQVERDGVAVFQVEADLIGLGGVQEGVDEVESEVEVGVVEEVLFDGVVAGAEACGEGRVTSLCGNSCVFEIVGALHA